MALLFCCSFFTPAASLPDLASFFTDDSLVLLGGEPSRGVSDDFSSDTHEDELPLLGISPGPEVVLVVVIVLDSDDDKP